jgi:hypothetical protein
MSITSFLNNLAVRLIVAEDRVEFQNSQPENDCVIFPYAKAVAKLLTGFAYFSKKIARIPWTNCKRY